MICRLCWNQNEIFYNFFDVEGQRLKIAEILSKHFWFQPQPQDNTSHSICSPCWNTIKNFHTLYLLAEHLEKNSKNISNQIKEDPCLTEELNFDDTFTENCSNGIHSVTEGLKIEENGLSTDSLKIEENSLSNLSMINENKSLKSEINDNDSLENIDEFIDAPENVEAEVDITRLETKRKRGRPPKQSTNSIREPQIIFEEDVYPLQEQNEPTGEEVLKNNRLNIKNRKNRKTSKKTNQVKLKNKRTPEQTEAFKKKLEEGDKMIAKFMKIVCDLCSEEQINFTTFKHHCTSVHGVKGFMICCQKKFYRKSKLVEHIEKHLVPDKYKCQMCNHIAATAWNLRLHMRTLHRKGDVEKPFKCSVCSKAFQKQSQLLRHELVHVPEDEKKFKCSYCDKNFPSEANLKFHVRLCHEGYYSGVCDICGKSYNNRQDLKRHRVQVHENGGEKEAFKCKFCDKEFKSRYSYKIHKDREHKSQNQNVEFKCTYCNKVSPNSEALRNHIQYVHKAKHKFQCTLCDKTFKRELGLKEHMAVHLGQSLYSCPHCPRTFTHSSNMHHHRKLKHPVEFEMSRKEKHTKKGSWLEYTSLNPI